jgi:nitroreductase
MEVLKSRRSIRKYEAKDVGDEVLNQVLDSVRWSPSWSNTQCWEVIVLRDNVLKQQLSEILGKNPATKSIVQAPVVLALCAKLGSSGYYKGKVSTKFGDWFMFDLGIAAQSMCLSAAALGLGTVIVGFFDHNKARDILGVPEDFEVVSLIPVGYPAKSPKAPKRRKISEFTHYDRF